MKKRVTTSSEEEAYKIIQQMDSTFRTSEAIKHGIHPRTLYKLREEGTIEQISRGIYRLAEKPSISQPDLVTVASRVPHAVVCLISALSFHQITTQIPHSVSIAIRRDRKIPKIDWPPISVYRFSTENFSAGIEKHDIDGVTVQVYSIEKTIADCFKYRNKIGMDVVIEALKFYKERKKMNVNELLKYAKICRVEKIMFPYLEILI